MYGKAVRRVAVAVLVMTATAGAATGPSHSDLVVLRQDPAPAAPGGTTTVHGVVGNQGPDRTASPFTVLIDLPAGFGFEGPYFPADCTTGGGGHLLRCTFPPGLAYGRSATVLAPVRVGRDVPPGTRAEGHVRVVSADESAPVDGSASFTLAVTG